MSGHQTVSSCLPLPPLPRRHGLGISPQAFPGLSCVVLQPFQHRILWRVLPIPPAPALLDEFLIDVRAIRQEHIGKRALVLVVAVRLERDFFPKGEVSGTQFAQVRHGYEGTVLLEGGPLPSPRYQGGKANGEEEEGRGFGDGLNTQRGTTDCIGSATINLHNINMIKVESQ